jgi:hypothetical protein
MKSLPEASISPAELQERIEFVKYLTDFLVQFTKTAETMKLNQLAYFLSMAALESRDSLTALDTKSGEAGLGNGAIAA